MALALLINPSYAHCYGNAKAGLVNPVHPTLGLASIAGGAIAAGHEVQILDLAAQPFDWRVVDSVLSRLRPDVVAITATTPLMNQVRDISMLVKSRHREILCVAGGPHVSALPAESMTESMLDAVCIGEGDFTLAEILDAGRLEGVSGLCVRDGVGTKLTLPRRPIDDLDQLPFPALQLYPRSTGSFRTSHLLVRRPPLAVLEFSRGCVHDCDFCASKTSLGRRLRKKSPERCLEEAHFARSLGYREIALADDIFTSSRGWALKMARSLAASKMLWSCTNGIRVESASESLFREMRSGGCYRVSFGIESGSDLVLQAVGKGPGASVAQARRAVSTAKAAGLEVCGYFMLGLSADTPETMKETIALARSLPLDMLKFSLAIAFPGSRVFDDQRRRGSIRSFDWDRYHTYTEHDLFANPALEGDEVRRMLSTAYRSSILSNPRFWIRRLLGAVRRGELGAEAGSLLAFLLRPELNRRSPSPNYFAAGRWPVFYFEAGTGKAESVTT